MGPGFIKLEEKVVTHSSKTMKWPDHRVPLWTSKALWLSILPCQLEHLEVPVQCSGSSRSLHMYLLSLQPRKALLYVAKLVCSPAVVSLNWETTWTPPNSSMRVTVRDRGSASWFFLYPPPAPAVAAWGREQPPINHSSFQREYSSAMRSYSETKKTPLWQSSPAEEQEELCPLPLLPEQQGFRTIDPLKSHQCSSPLGRLREPQQEYVQNPHQLIKSFAYYHPLHNQQHPNYPAKHNEFNLPCLHTLSLDTN